MIKKFPLQNNHFNENVIVYNPELTPERIREFVMTPFQTLYGLCQIDEDYRMSFIDSNDPPMNFWDFRKPDWNERLGIDRSIDFRVAKDDNIGVICRTDDEIKRYKHMIRHHYKVKDVWDCSILNVPVKTIFGRFIDEDEEAGDIYIDIADHDYAVVVPVDAKQNVEFIEIVHGYVNRENAVFLRTPREVDVPKDMLDKACDRVGIPTPDTKEGFRFNMKTERQVRSEVRKMMKDKK